MPRALLLSAFPSSDHPLTRPPVYSCTRIRPSLTPCVQVLLVEWAPVEWLGAGMAQTVKLRDLLRVDGRRVTPVRIITVPAADHDRLAAGTGVAFLEYMAKNVGARRARGQFVLLTNGDVLLSDAVLALLAQKLLREDVMYRMARVESPGVMDPLAPLSWRRLALRELVAVVGGGGEAEDEGLQGCGSDEVKDGVEEQERAAGGEFVLLSARALHRLGGFHQVASTLHSSGVTEVSLFVFGQGRFCLCSSCVVTEVSLLPSGGEHAAPGFFDGMQGTWPWDERAAPATPMHAPPPDASVTSASHAVRAAGVGVEQRAL